MDEAEYYRSRYIDAEGRFILRYMLNAEWKYTGPFMYEGDCERYIPIVGGAHHEVIKLHPVDYS